MLSRLPLGALVVVFLLTFAVWMFFYALDMPLRPPSTTIVAIIMLGVVIAARSIWAHRTKGSGK
jgi:hypothetical protein